MTPHIAVEMIGRSLKVHRFRYATEAQLQAGVESAFKRSAIPYVREHDFGGKYGRIDFLVAGMVGVEIKIKGSPSAVVRQLVRYADAPGIEALVLVTGRAILGRLPATILDKPLRVITLWEGFL